MKTTPRLTLQAALALSCVFGAVSTASAAGFALEEGSVRGNVSAAALNSKGGTPSALYFNPATITKLPGEHAEMGGTIIHPYASIVTTNPYTGTTTDTEGKGSYWFLPNAYYTKQMSDDVWFGVGMYTRYGLGSEFDKTGPTRYGTYKAEIMSFDVNPNFAFQLTDKLSFSVGISFRYFDVELAQKIDALGKLGMSTTPNNPLGAYGACDVDQDLHGDDIKPSIDLGLVYDPTDDVHIGLSYHSRTRFKVKGKAKWDKKNLENYVNAYASSYAPLLSQSFNNMNFSSVNFNPDKIMLSVAWDYTDDVTLSASAMYTTWSLYDTLQIDFERPVIPAIPTSNKAISPKKWHDTWRLSLGVDWAQTEDLIWHLGYTWDQSPLRGSTVDYMIPGDNRHIFGLGATWTFAPKWTLDASYFYEYVNNFDVKGRGDANGFSAGIYDGKFHGASGHALALAVSHEF